MSFKEIHISAPSKLILHGEHAVVYGKTAIAASLDLRTRMVMKIPNKHVQRVDNEHRKFKSFVQANDNSTSGGEDESKCSENCPDTIKDDMVTVNFPDVGIEEGWHLDTIREELFSKRPEKFRGCDESCYSTSFTKDDVIDGNQAIDEAFLLDIFTFLKTNKADLRMQSLVCFFYLYSYLCGSDPIPLQIYIESDIPIGAGLGSSAALSVCLSAGLLTIQDLKKARNDNNLIDTMTNGCINQKRLKLICDFAYISEQILHGRPSGIDNTASTYGGLIEFHNSQIVLPSEASKNNVMRNPPKLRILLVNTKIQRNTKVMVQKVASHFSENPCQVQQAIDEIDQLAKTSIELLAANCDILADDQLLFSKWGKLIDRNQFVLANGLCVSHSKLDSVCKLASQYGLHAKLTGAGGGGYAFVILPLLVDAKILQKITAELINMDCSVCETTLGATGGVKIIVL